MGIYLTVTAKAIRYLISDMMFFKQNIKFENLDLSIFVIMYKILTTVVFKKKNIRTHSYSYYYIFCQKRKVNKNEK